MKKYGVDRALAVVSTLVLRKFRRLSDIEEISF
jgi:hypothetical protein